MTEPPRRKFFPFQIHLPTAIEMMFVAAGLISANFIMRTEVERKVEGIQITQNIARGYGWPFFVTKYSKLSANGVGSRPTDTGYYWESISYAMILIDFVTALLLIMTAWFVFRWPIRRRPARKESQLQKSELL